MKVRYNLENFNEIFNWENFFKQSETFKNNKPFKFALNEEVLKRDFYEKLYETFPEYDESNGWESSTSYSKNQMYRGWGKIDSGQYAEDVEDPLVSPEWNKFYRFLHSKEFIDNIRKFSGIPVNKLKTFRFVLYHKGGFQLPHIHNEGPSTLIIFFYFSKGWQKGDAGGTYFASDTDESKILVEAYNLDNTMGLFQDGPRAAHGVRYITKDVKRKAIQIYLEEYNEKTGWSGKGFDALKGKIEL